MLIRNKLDKSFGPVGSMAGSILFFAGLIVVFTSLLTGAFLILLGAFAGFSSTGTIIDTEKRRIRFLNNFFGIIPAGKWLPIEDSMKLGLKESNLTWTSYSKGNRALDIKNGDYRVVLYDEENHEIMEVSKSDTPESASAGMEKISEKTGIALI
jgi:hypothetical protein